MSPTALKRQIAEKALQIAEYTRMAAEYSAEALAATSSVGYQKASDRANRMEAIAIRLTEEKQALERKLAAMAVAV